MTNSFGISQYNTSCGGSASENEGACHDLSVLHVPRFFVWQDHVIGVESFVVQRRCHECQISWYTEIAGEQLPHLKYVTYSSEDYNSISNAR